MSLALPWYKPGAGQGKVEWDETPAELADAFHRESAGPAAEVEAKIQEELGASRMGISWWKRLKSNIKAMWRQRFGYGVGWDGAGWGGMGSFCTNYLSWVFGFVGSFMVSFRKGEGGRVTASCCECQLPTMKSQIILFLDDTSRCRICRVHAMIVITVGGEFMVLYSQTVKE